LHTDELVNR